ncbi:MAG: DUF2156 domain-containing protein [Candidatus Fimenecus sp.]
MNNQLTFKKITVDDKNIITPYLKIDGKISCESCFGTLFMWGPIFDIAYCEYDELLLIKGKYENLPFFYFPYGIKDKKRAINVLIKYCNENKITLKFLGLSETDKNLLNKNFSDKFEITETRNSFDYIYKREKLAELSGRKLHSKRNHIAFFEKNNNFRFKELTVDKIPSITAFTEKWETENNSKDQCGLSKEFEAIMRALKNFEELSLCGLVLYVDDKIAGYSFGEFLNSNVFVTHVEKARTDLRGAYQIINRQLANCMPKEVEYINREDDTGSEGLRKSKLSYLPDILYPKFRAVYKDK